MTRILQDIMAFQRERFPLFITVPLALILFGAPATLGRLGPATWLGGVFATWLTLFCLRMADDLADLELDRRYQPQRGLAAGRIQPRSLALGLAWSWSGLLLLNLALGTGKAALLLSIYYTAYFLWGKKHLPLWLRPAASNLIFGLLVLFGPGVGGLAWRPLLALGVMCWLAAIAHEWAHNIRRREEPGAPGDYVAHYGPRPAAMVAAALFTAAAASGLLAWFFLGQPLGFGLGLLFSILHLGYLTRRLLQAPERRRARPFYVAGFTFFLVPLLGLGLENLLV